MPSTRRVKFLLGAVVMLVVMILYLTGDARRSQSQDFYQNTIKAMNEKQNAASSETDGDIQRLLQKAKDAADEAKAAATNVPVAKVPGEKGVAGRKKYPTEKEVEQEPVKEEDEEEEEVKDELNSILKKAPVIIFSKTTCPYSRKAKSILLDVYSIIPSPFVFEIDQHRLGPRMQSLLADMTGRRTVPNILINGKSIGGGDDVEKLHLDNELTAKVKNMGGKRIVEAKKRSER